MAVVLPQGALFRGGVEGADPPAAAREGPGRGRHRPRAEPVLRHRPGRLHPGPAPAQADEAQAGQGADRRRLDAVPPRASAELPGARARRARSSAGYRASPTSQDRARVVDLDEIEKEGWTLNISRYVLPPIGADIPPLPEAVAAFKDALAKCREAEDNLRRVMREGRLAVVSDAHDPARARVLPLGRGRHPARPGRRRRLQAVHLPAALLQAPLRRVGRGVRRGARRVEGRRGLRRPRRRTTASSIPDGAHWNDVRAVAEGRRAGRSRRRMRAIEAANPGRLDGIFGDAPWTNKERLPDVTLKNLLEHFSAQTLSLANVPEDELGNGYEFLIKKFADDSGHTAQEFYTNRTVVHLMAQMLEPQSRARASTTRPAAPAACSSRRSPR